MKLQPDINFQSVLYKGSSPLFSDIMGGHIEFGIDTLPATLENIKNKKIKALAVTSKNRVFQISMVPSLSENSKFPNFEEIGWAGLFAPKNIKLSTVESISKDISHILKLPNLEKESVILEPLSIYENMMIGVNL